MDWKIFAATFATIFLAELGDKTQIANLCLAAKSKSWFSVACASIIAFAAVTLITIALAAVLCKLVAAQYIKYGAASLFIVVGVLMFAGII